MQKSYFETINPATGEKLARYELAPLDEVMIKVRKAHRTYESKWSKISIGERSDYLRGLAKALRSKKLEYAKIITSEMGKPVTQSEAEVEKSAWTAEVYAENSENWLAEEFAGTDAKLSYVVYDPLGVILSIMPWNFPFFQVFRFAIPTLAAGNTTILRHSNVCPGSSLAVEEAFENAGFPEGVFSSVISSHDSVAKLMESDLIQGVSLTGSVEAGKKIGELAGRNLKKFVLELGGSDPFIVLEDADIEKAAIVGANARLINSGQSCIAAKRFIVVKSVAERFTERFTREIEKKKTGNPMDPNTDVGPLVNAQQVAELDGQVRDAISKGAEAAVGGKPSEGIGSFYEPTVLEKVDLHMKVMREEVFGPVAPICIVSNEEEAIRVANDSEFGLGAGLWTTNLEKAKRLARRLQSGVVFVNELVKSDPRMPFGGIKRSGIGRELSKYGLREFVNIKGINIYGIEAEDVA